MKNNIDNKKRNMIIGGTIALAVCIIGGSMVVKKVNALDKENTKETIITEDGEQTSEETTEFVVPGIVVDDKSNSLGDKDSDCETCESEEISQKSTLEQEIQQGEKVTYLEHNNIPNVVKVEELDINGNVITTEKVTELTTQAKTQKVTEKVTQETTKAPVKKQETTTQATTKKPQVTTTEKQTETTTKANSNSNGGNKKPQHGDVNEKGEVYDEDFDVWMKPVENVVEEFGSTDTLSGNIIGH